MSKRSTLAIYNYTNTGVLKESSGGGAVTVDAADVTYTPSTLANWNSSADPGDAADAFDQLASRTKTLESGTPAGGAIAIVFPNASLENWRNGTSSAPDQWTLTGTGATVAREATTIKHGDYSAALTRVGNDCHLSCDVYAFAGKTYLRGRTVTFGAWVYATVASRARLRVNDGTTTTYSSYHTGGSAWEFLTVTVTVGGSASVLNCGLQVDTGNTTAYLDAVTLAEGSSATNYQPQVQPDNQFPKRATLWHDESIATVGAALGSEFYSNHRYAVRTLQTTPANGDAFTNGFLLAAGTYTFYVLGATSSVHGKIDWYIDNVVVISGQDWYSAAETKNVVKSGSVTVTADGWHVLKGVINGKNASSTNYYMALTKMWFVPSAD